jgi:RIO kinase 1
MSTIDLDDYDNDDTITTRVRATKHAQSDTSHRTARELPGDDIAPEEADPFSFFRAEGIIAGEGAILKPGKEATVYRCPGAKPRYPDSVAVKMYKDVTRRSFKDLNAYMQGRLAESGIGRRERLHILSSPENVLGYWVQAEYRALTLLSDAGLPVPRPYGAFTNAIAMELVGGASPAPRLHEADLSPAEVSGIVDAAIHAVRRMLRLDIVHGDLSPYNILVRDGKPVIIDFPQAVDPRFNQGARAYLERDIRNVLRFRNAATGKPRGNRLIPRLHIKKAACTFARGLRRFNQTRYRAYSTILVSRIRVTRMRPG